MNTKDKRGGLRSPVGGRPTLPEGEKKVKISITIDKDLLDWIDAQLVAKRKRSQVIERLLRDAAAPTRPSAPVGARQG